MRIVYEQRASVILYNLLKSFDKEGIFLIPANVCPIVVTTFLKAKRPFEFIDISNETLCIDHEVILSKIKAGNKKIAGVLFVRTYGTNVLFDDLFEKIKSAQNSLFLIDDSCLSIPDFKAESKFADAVLFSTGNTKYVDIGFGGFALLKPNISYDHFEEKYNPKDHEQLIASFREAISNDGTVKYQDSSWLNFTTPRLSLKNYKNLVSLEEKRSTDLKTKINSVYFNNLPKEIQLGSNFNLWRFNILVPDKEQLLKEIFHNGLFASSHYAPASKLFAGNDCPNACSLYAKVINLFNDFHFDENRALEVTKIIKKFISKESLC
ncbi:hypothetical protein MUP35_04310 [Patescibacteria group bacterium]|nr:hypothetical protein [Patescibacteria group bacterium]